MRKAITMRRTRSHRDPEQVRQRAPAPPSATLRRAQPLDELQTSVGNEVVNRLVDAHIQAKLLVGSVDDPAERQADRVAEAVLERLGQSGGSDAAPAPGPGKAVEVDAAGGEVTAATERAIVARTGGGSRLSPPVRRAMEEAFGADLGAVRLHSGAESTELNRRLQSRAFTVGSDIFFRDAAPDMTNREGQKLLAHELAHTIQQGASVARSPAEPHPVIRRVGEATMPSVKAVDLFNYLNQVAVTYQGHMHPGQVNAGGPVSPAPPAPPLAPPPPSLLVFG